MGAPSAGGVALFGGDEQHVSALVATTPRENPVLAGFGVFYLVPRLSRTRKLAIARDQPARPENHAIVPSLVNVLEKRLVAFPDDVYRVEHVALQVYGTGGLVESVGRRDLNHPATRVVYLVYGP